ncbi:MAG: ferritin family protein [Rhodopila sp.]|nr:ferritin family protein [Rhodopila sp.]
MNKTGLVPGPVKSLDELLAVAQAMGQEAAARYRALSTHMKRRGDADMAAQFEMLANMEDRHAMEVAGRSHALLGRAPDPARVRWDLPADFDEAVAGRAILSAYQALAYAVRNEERAFAFYAYVAAEADQPDIRALAEDLARDELQHATLLRHYRRRAFHARRPAPVDIPETVDAVLAMSRRWDAEAAAAHTALAATLDGAGEAEDAAIFRRLAAREADAANGEAANATPVLRDAVDGLRLVEAAFDRYALIGERANNELVLIEAQRLAGEIVARLALTGGGRRNTRGVEEA